MIDVTGMTYEEAKKALNKIDLGIKDGGTQASEKYDAERSSRRVKTKEI